MLGVAAAFYGVAVGLTQTNAKTVLAYSSISQMGLITVGVGLAFSSPGTPHAALTATLVYAMHHGFAKGALFLGVGVASATAWGTLAAMAVRVGPLAAGTGTGGNAAHERGPGQSDAEIKRGRGPGELARARLPAACPSRP